MFQRFAKPEHTSLTSGAVLDKKRLILESLGQKTGLLRCLKWCSGDMFCGLTQISIVLFPTDNKPCELFEFDYCRK